MAESLATIVPAAVRKDMLRGMHWAFPTVLRPTQVLYKFAGSRRTDTGAPVPLSRQVRSPWWLTDADFARIARHRHLDAGNFGFIARWMCAVQLQWSVMDTLVKAVVLEPVTVFRGPGRPMFEQRRGAQGAIVYDPPADLMQSYLPDVGALVGDRLEVGGRPALGFVAAWRLFGDESFRKGSEDFDRAMVAAAQQKHVYPAPLLHM